MTGRELEEVSSRPGRESRLLDELCPERCSTGTAVVTAERGGNGERRSQRLSTCKAGIAIGHGLKVAAPGALHQAAVLRLAVGLAVIPARAITGNRAIGSSL